MVIQSALSHLVLTYLSLFCSKVKQDSLQLRKLDKNEERYLVILFYFELVLYFLPNGRHRWENIFFFYFTGDLLEKWIKLQKHVRSMNFRKCFYLTIFRLFLAYYWFSSGYKFFIKFRKISRKAVFYWRLCLWHLLGWRPRKIWRLQLWFFRRTCQICD